MKEIIFKKGNWRRRLSAILAFVLVVSFMPVLPAEKVLAAEGEVERIYLPMNDPAVAGKTTLVELDSSTGASRDVKVSQNPISTVYDGKGLLYVASAQPDVISVIDTTSTDLEVKRTIDLAEYLTDTSHIKGISFDPSMKNLYISTNGGNGIIVYNIETGYKGKILEDLTARYEIIYCNVTKDFVYTSYYQSGKNYCVKYKLSNGDIEQVEIPQSTYGLLSPDGKKMVFGTYFEGFGGKITIVNTDSMDICTTIDAVVIGSDRAYMPIYADFSPDGEYIYALYKHGSSNGLFRIYDANSGELKSSIDLSRYPMVGGISNDGTKVYSVPGDYSTSYVEVIDVSNPSSLLKLDNITTTIGIRTIFGPFTSTSYYVQMLEAAKHQHDFTYSSAEGGKIEAYCTSAEGGENCAHYATSYDDAKTGNKLLTLTLTADSPSYSGGAYSGASTDDSTVKFTSTTGTQLSDVEYYLSDGTTKTTAANSGAEGEGKAPKNVGNYVAKISVTDKTDTTDIKAKTSKAFTISPKAVSTLTASDITVLVGDTNTPTYTGSDMTPTVVVKDGETTLVVGTDYEISGDTTKKAVGTHTITVTGKGNYSETTNVTWKIVGADFGADDVTATGYSDVYDGQNHGIDVTLSGAAEGATVEYSLDGTNWSTTNPVDKNATASKTVYYRVSKEGYNTLSGSKTITITQKEVDIEWSNLSLTYDGTEQKPTATATGVLTGDTVTVNVSGGQTDTGTGYTATASITNPNYKIKSGSETKTYTVVPADQTAPTSNEGYTIDNEKIIITDGYEVSTSETFGGGTIVSNNAILAPNTTYYIRKKASGTNVNASPATSFTTPSRATTPATPAVGSKTDTGIKITVAAGLEFSIDGGESWNTTGEFTGLVADTLYTVKARVKATVDRFASEAVSFTVKTKESAPAAPTGFTEEKPSYIGNNDGKIKNVDEKMEYSTDGGATWTPVIGTEITGLLAGDVQIRLKETDTAVASVVKTVTVPGGTVKAPSPAAPTNLKTVSPSTIGGHDGKITGVNATMEYSTDGGKTWAPVTGTEITGLSVGDVAVRLKETDTTKAGVSIVLTVKDGIVKVAEDKQDGNFEAGGIKNTVEEVKAAVLTAEDKAAIEAGKDVSVWIEIKDHTETVTKEDKTKVEEKLDKDFEVGIYLDVSLWKQITGSDPNKVTDVPNGKVKIGFTIPKDLQKANRTYKIARVHDGIVEILDVTVDDKFDLTCETDRFSTYALIYSDSAADSPATGDTAPFAMYFMMMLGSMALAFAAYKKRRA